MYKPLINLQRKQSANTMELFSFFFFAIKGRFYTFVICVLLSLIYAYLLVRGHNIPQIYMCTFMTKYSQDNPTSADIIKMTVDPKQVK